MPIVPDNSQLWRSQCSESTRKLGNLMSVSSKLQFRFLGKLSDVVPGEVVRTRHRERIDLSQLLETREGHVWTEVIPVGIC